MKKNLKIEKLRDEIDRIDDQILEHVNKRAEIALKMAKIKKKGEYYAPEREKQIYERLLKANSGPLPSESVQAIYREIMSATRSLEHRLKIAYLGPEATFTHLASRRKFGSSVDYVPVKSISDVFSEVEKMRADYGVVPVENSTEGIITHTFDMFIDSDLKICGEIVLEITHNLLARNKRMKIRKVYSHPQALAQCRSWLESNLPEAEKVEVSSTAEAARLASTEKGTAAIASELAAELYNLKVISSRIEDMVVNVTRFLVIGKREAGKGKKDKTSIMFSIQDKMGALYEMLQPFRNHGINLTKIESRPSRRKAWDYYFFIDMEGHCEEGKVKEALEELEKRCIFLKILGSYPKGE